MVNRMPELKEWEDEMKQNGETSKELSPEKFAFFVERMKTKETTMEFMQEIQTAAPELYGALVGERDVFMGRAMDTLFSSSSSLSLGSNNPIMERMVSVVGLGHMQGIGKELKSLGWIHFVPSQCSH